MANDAKSMIKKLYPMDRTKRYPMKLCPQRRKIITSNYETWSVIGLQADGRLLYTGSTPSPAMPSVSGNIYSIARGSCYAAILDSKGVCTYTGATSGKWENIIDIEVCAYGDLIGLKADGTCVSTQRYGVNVSSWSNIVAISARGARSFVVGLKADGTCVTAGSAPFGVTSWKDIVAVCTGYSYVTGLKADGTCVSTSYNLSGWRDIAAISQGSDDGVVGLKSDGTCVSNYSEGVPSGRNIIAILGCNDNIIGVKADMTCVYVGSRYSGVSSWRLSEYVTDRGLIVATQPINLLSKTKVTGFSITGVQPTNTTRHVAFKVDNVWNKLTVPSNGVATLTPLATQEIDVDSIIKEGNTAAELAKVTSVPGFVGKLLYPAVALFANDNAQVMPTFGMTVKAEIDTTVNVYSYTDYSQEYNISDGDDVPIVSLVAETETKGRGAVTITARLKQKNVWSEYMTLQDCQMKEASAIQLKAVYTVQTTDGTDFAKIKAVVITYNTAGAITSNNTTDIVTVTEKFTNDLVYVHAYCKHRELIDAKINAFCAIRKQPQKRIMYQFGNGTGSSKTYKLPDKGINQDTLTVYVDGKIVLDFGYNTETSEITITGDKDTALSASYEYGWEMSNWIPMTQGVSQVNDSGTYTTEYTYIIPTHEGSFTVSAVKFELDRPVGHVEQETIGVGTGKRQIIKLPHIAKKETIVCNGAWSYNYDSQQLTVIAPDGENIVISYDWIAESPNIYAISAGWAD